MADVRQRAIELLTPVRERPQMYARTLESFLMRVTTILEMAVASFGDDALHAFYERHDVTHGCAYVNLDKAVETPWAQAVVDDALKLLADEGAAGATAKACVGCGATRRPLLQDPWGGGLVCPCCWEPPPE